MILKRTASTVHILGVCLSPELEQSAFGRTDKVVYRHRLTWKKVARLEHTSSVLDYCLVQSRCRVQGLFAILTSCTPGHLKELVDCSVEASRFLSAGKYTRPEEELHFLHSTMTKPVVSLQQLFLRSVEC